MTEKLKKTTIGGAEISHTSPFTDAELNLAFGYLYRLQSLRYDQKTSLDGMENYSIKPSDSCVTDWIFISLNDDIPVCITPEFELAEMISMAKTALLVTKTLKNLRMAKIAI